MNRSEPVHGMRTRARRLLLATTAASLMLGACSSMWGAGSSEATSEKAAPKSSVSGLDADLSPTGGSVVGGNVRFNARSGGVTMIAHLTSLPPGAYKVVIHANGLCNSPNGFSAGPPWAPEGLKPPLSERTVLASTDGRADLTVRIDGLALEGPQSIEGKSVVVHDASARTLEAEPGVRNGRVACGVIGPLHVFSF